MFGCALLYTSVTLSLQNYVFILQTCVSTFKIFKDVLVKVGIPRNCIFLAAKIIVSKSETPLCCELSLSVLKDILIPRWVLTVLLGISLNIFHQTEQLMAVYLKYYVFLNIDGLSRVFYISNCVIQKSPGLLLS